jgi:hypothetical protein
MFSNRPTIALTVFVAVVGLIAGCGIGHFKIAASIGSLVCVILLSVAVFAWFREDASRLLYRRSFVFNIAFVSLTIIVLPYYLFRSRGLWSGLGAIGVAALIYIIFNMALLAGALLVLALKV